MNADDAPIRVYVREGGTVRCIASCDEDSLAFTLITLADEGQTDGKLVGIMDQPTPNGPKRWLTNPFNLPGAEPVQHDPGQLRIRA